MTSYDANNTERIACLSIESKALRAIEITERSVRNDQKFQCWQDNVVSNDEISSVQTFHYVGRSRLIVLVTCSQSNTIWKNKIKKSSKQDIIHKHSRNANSIWRDHSIYGINDHQKLIESRSRLHFEIDSLNGLLKWIVRGGRGIQYA